MCVSIEKRVSLPVESRRGRRRTCGAQQHAIRGTYGTPEAVTRMAAGILQYVEPRGKVPLVRKARAQETVVRVAHSYSVRTCQHSAGRGCVDTSRRSPNLASNLAPNLASRSHPRARRRRRPFAPTPRFSPVAAAPAQAGARILQPPRPFPKDLHGPSSVWPAPSRVVWCPGRALSLSLRACARAVRVLQ